jgi:hypothetical protein
MQTFNYIKKETLSRIASIAMTDVASALGIEWSQRSGGTCMCRCFVHDDTHPSMQLYTRDNHYHCYACGAHGDNIDMVMHAAQVSWHEACQWLMDRFGIWQDNAQPASSPRRSLTLRTATPTPSPAPSGRLDPQLVSRLRGNDNDLCTSIVQSGILTPAQMRTMADTFRLGTSPEHGVIFWQIDRQGQVHEGKVMMYQADCHRSHVRHPYTISSYLKRQGTLPSAWTYSHCLFGLHQLQSLDPSGAQPIVAVVESEKTALICSQLVKPQPSDAPSPAPPVLWMATGGLSMLTARALAPLSGCRVILYPDTDPDGTTYRLWHDRAREASTRLAMPIAVSSLLELHATPGQKSRKIDIADYILEGRLTAIGAQAPDESTSARS